MGEYDGNYVTLASVRRTCGIGSSEISDTDIKAIIDECEPQVERYMNTSFTIKQRIDIKNGNGTNTLMLMKNPVVSVRDLYIDGTQEDTANLHVYENSGKIILSSDATTSIFTNKNKAISVKYLYGWMDESNYQTTTGAASTAGTSVSLTVADSSDFAQDDWVVIYSMDGNREVAQISSIADGTHIAVDQLILAHESGSLVVKLQTREVFKKLINLVCGIACVARIVGQSYTDIVGYTLGELHVQKGEPYTQWRETAVQLIKERDMLLATLNPRPYII